MSDSPDWFARASAALGFATSAVALALAAQLPLRLGLLVYTEQVLAALLGFSLGACFLTRPVAALGRAGRVADVVFAVLGVCVGLYLAVRYPSLSQEYYQNKTEAALIGVVLLPLILEGLRRATGPAITAVTLVFMVYALFANLAPGQLQGREMSPVDMVAFSAVDNVAIFGLPLTIAGVVVVMFIVFGQLLQFSGGGNWFTDLATCAVGRYRGGPAKIAVVASGLFGSISGSAVANVASTGILTIPMMKSHGFSSERAGAYEAVASTGGQIAPPIMGAAAFLMAEFLELSYTEVIIAAAIPAALFYFAVLLMADLDAARLGASGLSAEEIPPARKVFRDGWFYPLPFAALVFFLFSWNLGPAEAALWSAGILLVVVALFGGAARRIGPVTLLRALARGGVASVDIILIGAAAGIIIGILENTGLSFGLTYILVGLAEGELWILLAVTAVICILLGMGMPTTGIYVLVATLAGPPLIELGIDPLAAHLFVLYFGLMSMISPPVAIAAFTAASIAEARPMGTALTATRLGWIAFVMPFLFVADTALIMRGDIQSILIATAAVAFGIWAVGAGLTGYFLAALTPFERAVALAAGGMLLASRFDLAMDTVFLGLGAAGTITLYVLTRRRAGAAARATPRS